MHLIRDSLLLESFGDCGGTGRCATCVVKFKNSNNISQDIASPEVNTLSKINLNSKNTRLACQIPITKDLQDSKIEILEIE